MRQLDCIRRAVLALTAASLVTSTAGAQPSPAPPRTEAGANTYLVFLAGRLVGREELAVLRQADGWIFRGSSTLGPPVSTVVRHVEVRYDSAWRPKALELEASVQGRDVTLKTAFAEGKATSALTEGTESTEKVDEVSADPVVLPNVYFGTYAALAARLSQLAAGAELKAYIAPQAEIPLVVTAVTDERIETPGRAFSARRYALSFRNAGGDVAVTLWADTAGSLLRLSVPGQSLEVAREDVASAASRMSAFSIEGDESVRVAANGFILAATVTKPKNATGKLPAVVLISGAGPADRDGTVAGIPVIGQVARDLVAAGFLVIRYDKRGVGQSGGRFETATLADYADDARAVVAYLRKARKDVDDDRVAVVGHSEGAWIALQLAASTKDVAALVLVAGASGTGGALVLEQQQRLLESLKASESERSSKAELQTRINAAVMSQGSWEGIPKELRAQADTPWFASYLSYEPSKVMKDVRQPILIVQGERDTQVAPYHADKLAELARARKKPAAADVVKVPGVNHLLVPAETGAVSEYASLMGKEVAKDATKPMADWLSRTLGRAGSR